MDTNEENESLFDLESPAFIYEEEDSDETEQDESTEEESEEPDEDGTFEESEDEFESEEDALRSLIEKKTETAKKEAVEEYLESLPDNVKDYIDIGKKGGDIDKLKELESLPNFKEIPLTSVSSLPTTTH